MSSPPELSTDQPLHHIWPRPIDEPTTSKDYLEYLKRYFCGEGAALGPECWYLSKAEVYKHKKHLRHERFLATMQSTPRLPAALPASSNSDISTECRQEQEDYSRPFYLMIERSRDGNGGAEGSSNSRRNAPGSQGKEGKGFNLVQSLFGGLEITVKVSIGTHFARDRISFSFELPSLEVDDYKLIGQIDFPIPSFRLPRRMDYGTIIEELSTQRSSDDDPGPSSCTSSTTHPSTFVSLLDLISLASAISEDKEYYDAAKHNCYWYSMTLFFSLRSHTSSNVTIPMSGPGDQSPITITPDDNTRVVGQGFKQAQRKPGYFGKWKIVALPEVREIRRILAEQWVPKRNEILTTIRNGRIRHLQARRQEAEGWMRTREAKGVREGKADERETTERRFRERGWTEEDIKNFYGS